MPGILARDSEAFLSTEPPLVIRKELDIDVVHYRVSSHRVEVIDVKQSSEVGVFPQRAGPLGLPESAVSHQDESSWSLRLYCNGDERVSAS